MEEYVYSQDIRNMIQRAPFVGSWMDSEGYEMLLITLTGDLVTDSEFRTYRKKDRESIVGPNNGW